ncbi:armadillo-type protein [Melampsora americana]|nr:armadillo-type protein [Melampsora americana]
MENEEGLVGLIGELIEPKTENERRMQIENMITVSLIEEIPEKLISQLISISIQNRYPTEVRIQALVLVRKLMFKASSESTELKAWDRIKKLKQDEILRTFLECMLRFDESNEDVISTHLCHTISDVAHELHNKQQHWQDLQNLILEPPVELPLKTRNGLLGIYSTIHQNQSIEFRLSGLDASISTLSYLEASGHPFFTSLTLVDQPLYPILQTIMNEIYSTLLEPLIILHSKQTHQWLNPFFKLASNTHASIQTRSNAIESYLNFIDTSVAIQSPLSEQQKASSTIPYDDESEYIKSFYTLLLSVMSEVHPPTPEWLNKSEDNEENGEDEEDLQLWVIAEQDLDRLINLIGPSPELILPILNFDRLQSSNHSTSWQEIHASLSAIGALADSYQSFFSKHINRIYHFINFGLVNLNPRVVHAAIYALAQLSSSLNGTLQSVIGHQVLETLSQTTLNPNQSIRIRAYGAMCIVNYLTGFENSDPVPIQSTNVLRPLLSMIQSHQPTSLRKAGLDALSRLWSYLDLQLLLVSYEQEALGKQLEMIADEVLNNELDQQTSRLEERVYNCLAYLANAIGEERFLPDSTHWIQRSITSIERRTEEKIELLMSFCYLSKSIQPPQIQQYLDWLIENLMKYYDHDQHHDQQWQSVMIGDRPFGIKTSAIEEKVGALEGFFNDDVREAALLILPAILRGAKASNIPDTQLNIIGHTFAKSILEILSHEPHPSTLLQSLISTWTEIYDLIRPIPELSSQFLEICESLMERFTSEIGIIENGGERDEDQEESMMASLSNMSRSLRSLVIEGINPKWNKIISFVHLYSRVVENGEEVEDDLTLGLRRWAFRMVAGFVQGMEDGRMCWELVLGPVAGEVQRAFSDSDACIRGLAPFIIGLCAQHSDSNPVYGTLIQSKFQQNHERLLLEGMKVERVTFDQEEIAIKIARENCVSALAKIIRNPIESLGANDLDQMLEIWIEPTYGLLLELIAREHPSIDPIRRSETVVKGLLSALKNPKVPKGFKDPLLVGLRTYCSRFLQFDQFENQGGVWQEVKELI